MSFDTYVLWLCIVTTLLIGLSLAQSIFRFREKKRLIAEGRSMTWNEALERIAGGDGNLVINRTSLPGRFWWIPSRPSILTDSLFDEVKQTGYLIIGYSKKEVIRAAKTLKSKVYTLNVVPLHSQQS